MPKAHGRKDLTGAERGEILGLKKTGLSNAEIARRMAIDPRTVKKWVERAEPDAAHPQGFQQPENWAKSLPRTGRRKSLNQGQEAAIQQACLEAPINYTSFVQQQALEHELSYSTVRRSLRNGGLFHFRPAKKLNLTEQHKATRLAWAQANLDNPQIYWDLMCWTDEKIFKSDQDGTVQLWRPRNTR